jgi:glycine dehydrogenase subunit 1
LLDRPVPQVLEALAERGILGGLDLTDRYPELGHALLICATETKTETDIAAYAAALADIMSRPAPRPLESDR